MKNQFMLKSLKFALAMVFILFVSSCTDETDALNITEDDSSLQIISSIKEGQLSAKDYDVSDCTEDCIEVGSEDYFEKEDSQIVSWGGKEGDKFSKTVDIIYYNTETEFVLKVRSTNGWSDLVIGGVSSWTDGPVDADEYGTYSFSLEEGWKACDIIDFRLQVTGNSPQADFDVSYNLFGVCGGCDDESFSVVTANNNLDLLFTYDSALPLTGAIVEFTFPQIMNLILTDGKYINNGKEYTVNNSGNQTVLTWIGDIGCMDSSAETFSFSVLPDCNSSGKALIWTDMKVNGDSVKVGIDNLKHECTD